MCIADVTYIYHMWSLLTIAMILYMFFCFVTGLTLLSDIDDFGSEGKEFKRFVKFILYSFVIVGIIWMFLPGPTDMLNLLTNHFVCPGEPEQAKEIVEEILRSK